MAIYEDIKNFNQQFSYQPKIENEAALKPFRKKIKGYVVAGMGGSHLAGDILQALDPSLDLMLWKDYGLPPIPISRLKEKLIIASSYSGNTEETISALMEAKRRGLPLAVIAAGGQLIELAQKYNIAYVRMPNYGMQPRMALGLSVRGLLKLIGHRTLLQGSGALVKLLHAGSHEADGKKLAHSLAGDVPIIYSSARNAGLAYIWKIKLNETGKIPAFYNLFPELNHNEMTGFDAKPGTRSLSGRFHFLFLKDSEDDPRVQKRMHVTDELYRERGLKSQILHLSGKHRMHKIFSSLVLADWTAYHTAMLYGVEPEQVPMVEDFKKRIV